MIKDKLEVLNDIFAILSENPDCLLTGLSTTNFVAKLAKLQLFLNREHRQHLLAVKLPKLCHDKHVNHKKLSLVLKTFEKYAERQLQQLNESYGKILDVTQI